MYIGDNLKLKEEFGVFFIENFPRVRTFAQQILMSKEDAEDVAQDIFLKLIDMPEIWREDKERRNNYLFRMTKNHVFNLIKRRNIEHKYKQNLYRKNRLYEDFGLEEHLHAREIELIIMFAVEQMPEKRRRTFRMSRYEGKSNLQIAELQGMSVRTVERHLYLALAELKKALSFILPVE
ncbi:MAG: RNA polymerase sigma-70 factor [Prevotella sp.]|jgi:RNA polymerase sigma-70 factor (ECF subfamily)|nr:RNA polymerase sigma-70 factor [Prevotella sp.]